MAVSLFLVTFANGMNKREKLIKRCHYKGYTGSVEYSEQDNCLYGKVQGLVGAGITYEGHSVEELTEDFHGAIDYYLQMCKDHNIVPKRPFSGSLNVRLSPETHFLVASVAQKEGITINAFIKKAVSRELEYAVK